MERMIQPLHRDEVIKAVERKNPSRIPLVNAKWWGEGLEEQYGNKLNELDRYPEDVVWLFMDNPVDSEKMDLSWEWKRESAHESTVVIDDWNKLDEFIEKLPNPANDPQFEKFRNITEKARSEDRYILFGWWCFFFEQPWHLRGMENLMIDHFTHQTEIHKLHHAMCKTYCDYINEVHKLFQPDGFWTSDDLGHQTGSMMSPEIFHELLFPYYTRVANTLKENQMHFWLHSCGNNTPLLPDLIESGLTVFHPVQKGTMDEVAVAKEFGSQLTFLAGIDVQHTLQEKGPEGVRKEVRFLIDTFGRSERGMCIAAGNGIVAGTPFENIEAFLDEAVNYGSAQG